MVLVSIIIAVKTEHPEKLVMFIPSIPTFSGLNEELSYNVIPRVRRIFCLRQEFVWRLFLNLLFFHYMEIVPVENMYHLYPWLCTYRCKTIIWTFADVCPKDLGLSLAQQLWSFFNFAAVFGNNC